MDVSAPRPPDPVETSGRFERTPPAGAVVERPREPRVPAPEGERWVAPSLLKFTLSAADVDAKFEIHEATDRVTVTMYERLTGEVLREIPSREVLDVIAALLGTGLTVDTIS